MLLLSSNGVLIYEYVLHTYLQANLEMQFTSTSNNVFTRLFNDTLHHGVRLRQPEIKPNINTGTGLKWPILVKQHKNTMTITPVTPIVHPPDNSHHSQK